MSVSMFARSLRAPSRASAPAVGFAETLPPMVFWLLCLGVMAHLTVSANLLYQIGIDYAVQGGFRLQKFHPGTYFIAFSLAVYCFISPRPAARFIRLLGKEPYSAWMLGGFVLLSLYYSLSLGPSGVAVFVENFMAACVVALLGAQASLAQLRTLGWAMLGLIALNAPLAISETLGRWHLVPLYLAGETFVEPLDDWRGAALYDHPLTGALVTQMGIFLLLAAPVREILKLILIGLLLIALVSFGGRTALAVTLLVLLILGALILLRGLLYRTLRARVAVLLLLGLIAGPPAITYIVSQTSIGSRIEKHLYAADDSAAVRFDIWNIPDYMTTGEILFGANATRQGALLRQVGYIYPQTDIENFWLLSFVNLGLFGFILYLAAFLPFLWYLFSSATAYGKTVLVTTIIIASSSNSLARKSNILVLLVATILSVRGFAEKKPLPERRQAVPPT